jgi:thiamine-phosphate pyrophosphorylase
MKDPSSWSVCLVTDRGLSKGRTTRDILERAVEGGVSVVQLREKGLDTRRFLEEGIKIKDFLRARGIPLIINDRIDVALALDADGVHLGRSDMPVDVARRLLGPAKIIGLSVNEASHITEESAGLADYLAISPLFHTATKEDITKPWGLTGLAHARSMTDKPLCAIGGVHAGNAGDITRMGADFVAVVSAIVSSDDPEESTRLLVSEASAGKKARTAA